MSAGAVLMLVLVFTAGVVSGATVSLLVAECRRGRHRAGLVLRDSRRP